MDDDAFWKIALDRHFDPDDSQSSSEEHEDDETRQHRLPLSDEVRYTLSFPHYPTLALHLCDIPRSKRVVPNSLGAQAWYGSALLTALMLLPDAIHGQRIHQFLAQKSSGPINALELGSGAVGLAGIALAWRLKHRSTTNACETDQIILTDRDPLVLDQLTSNVESAVAKLERYNQQPLPSIIVEYLDWREGFKNKIISEKEGSQQLALNLVIGSELVYNTDTGRDCATLVQSILAEHHDVLIVVVQVAGRDGWTDGFLRDLSSGQRNLSIDVQALTDIRLHETAEKLIPLGGPWIVPITLFAT